MEDGRRRPAKGSAMDLRQRYIVKPGKKLDLGKHDPDETPGYDKKSAKAKTKEYSDRLKELEYVLYAENRRSLLVVLQAIDAGGKDGAIRHVMGPLNPQSCRVTSFKTPTEEDLAHDFLWRVHRAVPRHGQIGIFNRSHYEDVLIVRVHNLAPKKVWSRRYRQINDFERLLADSNTTIVKFFLHISKDEQLERFRARLEDPNKHWKASPADFEERKFWDDYMAAFEEALSRCSHKHAPWYVIPANHKWFRNLAISEILVRTMEGMNLKFPEPAFDVSSIVLE